MSRPELSGFASSLAQTSRAIDINRNGSCGLEAIRICVLCDEPRASVQLGHDLCLTPSVGKPG